MIAVTYRGVQGDKSGAGDDHGGQNKGRQDFHGCRAIGCVLCVHVFVVERAAERGIN